MLVSHISIVSPRTPPLSPEDALQHLEEDATKDDETEENCAVDLSARRVPPLCAGSVAGKERDSLSQTGDMGDFCASLDRTCLSASDLPRRASWSLTNFAFARLCWGVWACVSSCQVSTTERVAFFVVGGTPEGGGSVVLGAPFCYGEQLTIVNVLVSTCARESIYSVSGLKIYRRSAKGVEGTARWIDGE